MIGGGAGRGLVVAGSRTVPLEGGWELLRGERGAAGSPFDAPGSSPIPFTVPGTVAEALVAAGTDVEELPDLDADDWWVRYRFERPALAEHDEACLRFDGLATVCDGWLNDTPVLSGTTMFRRFEAPVTSLLAGTNDLVLRFRALGPLLLADRRPRPRWKTRLVEKQALRWHRTTLFGRIPAFAPGPAAVGPWRPVSLDVHRRVRVDRALVRPRHDGRAGSLDLELDLRALGTTRIVAATAEVGAHAAADLRVTATADGVRVCGSVVVPDLEPWWPHTHGPPARHPVAITLHCGEGEEIALDAGLLGFRGLRAGELERFALEVNGVPVFCRGAVLLPHRLTLDHRPGALAAILDRVVAAGMNTIRLPGFGVTADAGLLEACDEHGILLWQDLPFANLDYPVADDTFRRTVEEDAADFLEPAGSHACLGVVCGGSEVEQQAAMLGADLDGVPGPLFEEVLPGCLARARISVPYVRSTPTGGDLPFRSRVGIAHYHGIGGYRRPLTDARRAGVRFAAECLAFAHVPDDEELARAGSRTPFDRGWKHGVPRDNGASWDFDDVRDHYLAALHSVDPTELRARDPDRYRALSRAVTGEVATATLGEWRRRESPCAGALLWTLNDVVPGPGFGLLGPDGRPKPAYWSAARALAPVATWIVDEGLDGLSVHVANDRPAAYRGTLEVATVSVADAAVRRGVVDVELGPRTSVEVSAERVLGGFVDVSYAYRFGPAGHDLVVATLRQDGEIVSRGTHLIDRTRLTPEPLASLGLTVGVVAVGEATVLGLSAARLAYDVAIALPGWTLEDNHVLILPGEIRTIRLRAGEGAARRGSVTALNGIGEIALVLPEDRALPDDLA